MMRGMSNLRTLREQHDPPLSQSQLSRRADVDEAVISRIEHGRGYPTVPNAKRLAKALGVTVDELFDDEEVSA